jgi:hypothetical protein
MRSWREGLFSAKNGFFHRLYPILSTGIQCGRQAMKFTDGERRFGPSPEDKHANASEIDKSTSLFPLIIIGDVWTKAFDWNKFTS